MTKIRNIYGTVIATGEGTAAEVAATNRADLSRANLSETNLIGANLREAYLRGADLRGSDLRWADLREADLRGANLRGADLREADLREADLRGANLSYIPAPLVLLAHWGELPDALTLDLMRYDAANHPEPERFLAWADGGPCPYAGLSIARAANFHERLGLIGDDSSLPVKSAWDLTCELAKVKGFRFAPEEDR